jgi:CubicO group peptidase (beta-lactamase class C family)
MRFPRLVVLIAPFLLASPAPAAGQPIADALTPFVKQKKLAGAVVLVSTPDRTVALWAVGYSDVAAKAEMAMDDLFWIASMSKPMTATALMMLVDEGKVRLDDPVEKYLPEFRGQMVAAEKGPDRIVLKKPAHPITVRNILSHTSGLVGRSPLENKFDELPLRVATITYGLSPLQFEPGSKYEYCNPGINTAGRIIEVASGMPYEDFMQSRLFYRLGMKDTTFWPTESQEKRIAKSYKPNASHDGFEEIPITQLTYPLTDRAKRHPYPAGGLYSTAADVAVFGRMILNGGVHEGTRLLSESAVRQMTSTQTGDLINGGEGGYGLGWSTSRKSPEEGGACGPCGHGGAYDTHLDIDPQRKLVFVYMVQRAGYKGEENGAIYSAFKKAAEEAFGK